MTGKIAVIGLGYVGFPLALLFCRAGREVVGIDIDEEKLDKIRNGVNPFTGMEPGMDELFHQVLSSGRLKVSTDYSSLGAVDNIVITIDTPINKDTKRPRLDHIDSALESISRHLQKNTLVVVESTIPPTLSREHIIPLLEERTGFKCGTDFYYAHFPERISVGSTLEKLATFPRVLGACSDACAERALGLYDGVLTGDIDVVDVTTAEFVKTAENAYRDVQIAFANELALLAEEYGIDVYKARELINKIPHPIRDVHLPGAGVGGHCLTKDGLFLISSSSLGDSSIVAHARIINDSMPVHVMALLEEGLAKTGLVASEVSIGVFGLASIRNSDDTRESPTSILMNELITKGLTFLIHDPFVVGYGDYHVNKDLSEVISKVNVCVFMMDHDVYTGLAAEITAHENIGLVIDGRNIFQQRMFEDSPIVYLGIGKSKEQG